MLDKPRHVSTSTSISVYVQLEEPPKSSPLESKRHNKDEDNVLEV